jgi:hypothetical protein
VSEQEELIAGPHLVRYGIAADQKYLVGSLLDTYDELVINGRMVAHMAAGLALFLGQRALGKHYLVDPETHAFQHGIEYLQAENINDEAGDQPRSTIAGADVRLKKSIEKMILAYGDPIETVVRSKESILPQDFDDPGERRAFCERVLRFQRNAIAERAEESEDAEYYEFLEAKGIVAPSAFIPRIVIAPYFCMDGNTFDEWARVNVSCAKDSFVVSRELNTPLAVQIVISQSVLSDPDQRKRLAQLYGELGPATFLLWVDSFNEHEASIGLLQALVETISELKKQSGGRVINLYGGYFSIMLYHLGILDGATHGLEYGEERSFVPVGGGIPTAKFYLPALHVRLRPEDAIRAVRALGGFANRSAFLKNVCDCERCRSVIIDNPEVDFGNYLRMRHVGTRAIPYPETKDNSVTHYMLCKKREFSGPRNISDIVAGLRQSRNSLRRALGAENTDHCEKWAEALTSVG